MKNMLYCTQQMQLFSMRRRKVYSVENSASPFYMQFCSLCSTSFLESMPFCIMHRAYLKWPVSVRKHLFYNPFISDALTSFSHSWACPLSIKWEEKHY